MTMSLLVRTTYYYTERNAWSFVNSTQQKPKKFVPTHEILVDAHTPVYARRKTLWLFHSPFSVSLYIETMT